MPKTIDKTRPEKPEFVGISIRPEVRQQIRRLALDTERDMHEVVECAVKHEIARVKNEKKAKP